MHMSISTCKDKKKQQADTPDKLDRETEEDRKKQSDERDSVQPLTGTAVTRLRALCRFEKTMSIRCIR